MIQEALLKAPRLNLTDRQFFDLEMLLLGGFAPLSGFLNEDDYKSVVENMHLQNGALWPIPITLDIDLTNNRRDSFSTGKQLVLCDEYGTPHAVLDIESVYKPNKQEEAELVYGTNSTEHPGVNYLLDKTNSTYIGGTVHCIKLPVHRDFAELRHTPEELRKLWKKKKFKNIIGFQTRNPVHRAHFELMQNAANEYNGHILLHPAVGVTRERDIDYITRVHSYKELYKNRMKDFATLSLLPLAMRMAGPREALWHALIRKNYGCTHFLIGRDHAGPGKNGEGKHFYKSFEALELTQKYETELGIKIISGGEQVYVEDLDIYKNKKEVSTEHKIKTISGTQFRDMLRTREQVPEWFSFPEVIRELQKGVQKESRRGLCVFFTGLSCAGKSTIAHMTYTKLLEETNKSITYLDGDIVREHLSKGLGFSKEDRDTNIARIGYVASEIVKHGGVVICAAIAPYKEARSKARKLVENNGVFIEIFVNTPVSVCEVRDSKGLYKKARKGLIKNFTGVNDPYEIPIDPEIELDTQSRNPVTNTELVLKYIKKYVL